MRLGRELLVALAAVGGLGLCAGPASGATSVSHTDPTGDLSPAYAMGDIVAYSLANDGSTITMGVTVAAFDDPATSYNWVDLYTTIEFALTLHGGTGDEYLDVTFWNDGTQVEAYSTGDCPATPGWDAASRRYWVTMSSSCLGNPRTIVMYAAMTYETDDDSSFDDTEETSAVSPSWAEGYWMVTADGNVYPFGGVAQHGHANVTFGYEVVDLEPTPSGLGYWLLDETGHVTARGDAVDYGSAYLPAFHGGERATAISRTRSGYGYWVFTNFGRVIDFGDAEWFGDMANVRLNGLVLDSIPTATGRGYYMVASDGGIFAFGDAMFYGSMGGRRLNAPVMSLVPDPDGRGYWLVASDGGVFAFDASFRGSMGAARLNRPVTGMVPFGDGYLMVGEDGGIFNFSNRRFFGSLGGNPPASPVVSVAVG